MSFRHEFGEHVFRQKYAQGKEDTWCRLAARLTSDVVGTGDDGQALLGFAACSAIYESIRDMKFIPGGRYLYYAGRPLHAFQNCYLLRGEEDTREEWGNLLKRASDCLMTGGGIGIDYSVFRGRGSSLSRTGGQASGPIPLMKSINEVGRNVMQGGSRRSAIYASLNWQHSDAQEFLTVKNWSDDIKRMKEKNFNFPADLDMTNISLNYDDAWLKDRMNETFIQNVRQALMTAEPGFSFNFGDKQNETLRNACTEVTSEDDSDVCNLGSINMANIETLDEFREIVRLATWFLVCGTIRGDLPYEKVYKVREKNRRLGLGLMGIHEWLLKRGYEYGRSNDEYDGDMRYGPPLWVLPRELREWLEVYRDESRRAADELCDRLSISRPVACRAIAPTGTIGILAGTSTGIEPIFSVACMRRYLTNGTQWKYEYVVDPTADYIIKTFGVDPDSIETSQSLAADPERRIAFQAAIQHYVDQAISSTINLPAWGSELNNEDKVIPFAQTLAAYAPFLRGFTCYPDGSRGGQPLTTVPYSEAIDKVGVVFDANEESCKGGVCGI